MWGHVFIQVEKLMKLNLPLSAINKNAFANKRPTRTRVSQHWPQAVFYQHPTWAPESLPPPPIHSPTPWKISFTPTLIEILLGFFLIPIVFWSLHIPTYVFFLVDQVIPIFFLIPSPCPIPPTYPNLGCASQPVSSSQPMTYPLVN